MKDMSIDVRSDSLMAIAVFSSLARYSEIVTKATVSLTSSPVDAHSVACCVAVTIGEDARIRVTARGRHAYEAINRASERIGDALRGYIDGPGSSCPCVTRHTH
jgi:phosphotransferase system HPr-like phosphotransfer protein